MDAESTQNLNESAGVPLVALAIPSALVVASWLVEAAGSFATGSRGAGLVALLLILGAVLSLWPIFVIARRLIYFPRTRRWPHFALLAISIVTFVPAVTFAMAVLMGL